MKTRTGAPAALLVVAIVAAACLTTIIGFTQLLLRDPSLPAPARKRLHMVFKEGVL